MGIEKLAPGAIFAGDFKIVRQIGEGGMGTVYVAEQMSTGRERALKLMLPSVVSSADLREKFEREAKVGARIKSEHVVEVIAAGVDAASGTPWLAMELLVGEDLARNVIRRGPLPLEEVGTVLEQVAHGLDAAHRAGIVHRDLKPENIFLAESQSAQKSFTAKLLDFGIAKVVEASRRNEHGRARLAAVDGAGADGSATPRSRRRRTSGPSASSRFFMITGRWFWLAATQQELYLHGVPPRAGPRSDPARLGARDGDRRRTAHSARLRRVVRQVRHA